MLERPDYTVARDLLLGQAEKACTEEVKLEESAGRILAQEVRAASDVPSFDRSPYDGYAFRAQDVRGASSFAPVTLTVVDNIAAGDVPHTGLTIGTAARIMTGAPVPEGADAILPYEVTKFTENEVQIFSEAKAGQNIVRRGEDVAQGQLLAVPGTKIDAGLAGTLAAQGIFQPSVYKKPVVGIISTGDELIDEGDAPQPGKIYNTNRYSLQAACAALGCESVYLGMGKDSVRDIAQLIHKGIEGTVRCDAIVLSGGVSAGDFDLTPEAMKVAGVRILVKGLALKPGMAGAYGVISNLPVMALSGNPAACMTAFWLVAAPVLLKIAGLSNPLPREVDCELLSDFPKSGGSNRVLRGKSLVKNGKLYLEISPKQGNVVLHTVSGSDLWAVVPAGSGPLRTGTVLRGYMVP